MVVYINSEFVDYMKKHLERQGFENVRIKAIAILRHAVAVYFTSGNEYIAWIPQDNIIAEVYRGPFKLRGEFLIVPREEKVHFLHSVRIYRIHRVGEDGYVRRKELRPGLYSGTPFAVFTVNDDRLSVVVCKARFNAAAVLHGVVA
jgi:hypothetical protein